MEERLNLTEIKLILCISSSSSKISSDSCNKIIFYNGDYGVLALNNTSGVSKSYFLWVGACDLSSSEGQRMEIVMSINLSYFLRRSPTMINFFE